MKTQRPNHSTTLPALALIHNKYSIFNRIFENLVYKRLIKFVDKHSILYSSQYGFRGKHSTQHATLEILKDILTNFDKGQFTCCLFIDLKKGFRYGKL